MINILITIAIYSGITLLIVLGLKLIVDLIKRKKDNSLRTLWQLLNFGVILTFCLGAFIGLALVVNTPSKITDTLEGSLQNLRHWLFGEMLEISLVGLSVITLLGIVGHLYREKVQKLNSIRPTVLLAIVNCIIVLILSCLIYKQTYEGLSNEVSRHFN